MLKVLIFILLCLGAYADIKRREVPHLITIGIVALSIPLIFVAIKNFTLINVIIISLIIMSLKIQYELKVIGAADIKIIWPTILYLSTTELWVWYIFLCVILSVMTIKLRQNAPMVLGIALSYTPVALWSVLHS